MKWERRIVEGIQIRVEKHKAHEDARAAAARAGEQRAEQASPQAKIGFSYLAEHGQPKFIEATKVHLVTITGFKQLPDDIKSALGAADTFARGQRGSTETTFSIANRKNIFRSSKKVLPPEQDTVTCELQEFIRLCEILHVENWNEHIEAVKSKLADSNGHSQNGSAKATKGAHRPKKNGRHV